MSSISRSIGWGAGGTAIRTAVQFFAQIYILRIVGPIEVGYFGVSLLLIGYVGFLSELLGSSKIIQTEELTEDFAVRQNTAHLVLGVVVVALAWNFVGTVLDSIGYPSHKKQGAAMLLCIIPLLLSAVPQRILIRQKRFKELSIFTLVSYLVPTFLVALPLAISDKGEWALVVAWIVQCISFMCLSAYACRNVCIPFRFKLTLNIFDKRGIIAFCSCLVTWTSLSIDRVLAPKLGGQLYGGTYVAAYNITMSPLQQLVSTIQQVFFSFGSNVEDHERLAKIRQATGLVLHLIMPSFLVLSLFSDNIIRVVLGAAWNGTAGIVAAFAIAAPFVLMTSLTTPVIWAKDRVEIELLASSAHVVITVTAILALYQMAGEVVHLVAAAMLIARYFMFAAVVRKLLGQRLRIFELVLYPAILTLVLFGLGYTCKATAVNLATDVHWFISFTLSMIAINLGALLFAAIAKPSEYAVPGFKRIVSWRGLNGNQ